MHFAALAYVGESVEEPLTYYQNNTAGTLSLLRAMDAVGVKRLVFSSTCATYGVPEKLPISETTPQQPINPYGWSKLFVERMLIDNTMRRHKGSIQSVMEELCLPRRTLNEKMAKYGLTRSNYVG